MSWGRGRQPAKLKRSVNWDALFSDDGVERIEIDADTQHARILVSTANLSNKSKLVGAFGVRVPLPDVDVELSNEARRQYQSMAMRLVYIAQDRPEPQDAAKKLAWDVSKPKERSALAFKRVCRFL